MEPWKQFFEEQKDYHVSSRFYEVERAFTVEELYQHFKARLMAELLVSAPDLRTMGLLVDRK